MPSSPLLRTRVPRNLNHLTRPRSLYQYFSTTTPRSFAQQNQNPDQETTHQRAAQLDREKIDRDSNEYSKSGTDESSAANEEAAFDPNITDPQEAKKKAGEGNRGNPLDTSPASPEISQGTREEKKKETE